MSEILRIKRISRYQGYRKSRINLTVKFIPNHGNPGSNHAQKVKYDKNVKDIENVKKE